MANKQRGSVPPVLSSEETRVRPLEEDEEELPSEPSWDPQRDSTQLLPSSTPRPTWDGVDEATPAVPRKLEPIPFDDEDSGMQEPFDATRPIPRNASGRPLPQPSDDATRPIARKTGARPALQTPDDATRPIPRKTGSRPALREPDDATRPIPRKSGAKPALPREEPEIDLPLPWNAGVEDEVALPTRAQGLPPIVSGPQQALVHPPEGPPVLVPLNTQPHYIPQAPSVPLVTQPHYVPPPPPASGPMLTSPNYVPPPPAVLNPVVTAPHLLPQLQALPPSQEPPVEELRTAFSNKAAMVADLVKATFARRNYGVAPYRLRIDEPDGPSTAGGLHARQPISLVSNMESAPAVVCGWVDVSKKEAQLRSYGVVVKRHQSRYVNGLDITEQEYDRFLNELVETLFYGGIKIVVQVPDDEPVQTPAQAQAQAKAQPQRSGRSALGTLLMLAVTFLLGLALGVINAEGLTPLLERVKALLPGH